MLIVVGRKLSQWERRTIIKETAPCEPRNNLCWVEMVQTARLRKSARHLNDNKVVDVSRNVRKKNISIEQENQTSLSERWIPQERSLIDQNAARLLLGRTLYLGDNLERLEQDLAGSNNTLFPNTFKKVIDIAEKS